MITFVSKKSLDIVLHLHMKNKNKLYHNNKELGKRGVEVILGHSLITAH